MVKDLYSSIFSFVSSFLPLSPEVLRKPHRDDLEGNITSLTLH